MLFKLLNSSVVLSRVNDGIEDGFDHLFLPRPNSCVLRPLEFQQLSVAPQDLLSIWILVVLVVDPVHLGPRFQVGVSQYLVVHVEDLLDLLECRRVGVVVKADEPTLLVVPLLRQNVGVLGLEPVGKGPESVVLDTPNNPPVFDDLEGDLLHDGRKGLEVCVKFVGCFVLVGWIVG